MKIITKHNPPPIPVRTFDWRAYVDGREDYTGWGATSSEAVDDLLEKLPEAMLHLPEEPLQKRIAKAIMEECRNCSLLEVQGVGADAAAAKVCRSMLFRLSNRISIIE